MFTDLGETVIRHRWWVLVCSAAILFAAGSGISRLTATSETRVFFSEANPYLRALEDFEAVYSEDDTALLVLEPATGSVFAPETLAAVEALTEAAWQIPYSRRVDSLTNFQHSWAVEDDLTVEDLVVNAQALSDDEIARIKTIALSEPLLVDRLVSPTGHVTGVLITIAKPGVEADENTEVALAVRQLAQDFRADYPHLNVYVTGGVIINRSFTEATEADMRTLIPLMFGVMVLVILLMLGSVSATLATLIVIAASAATAMGLAGWYGVVMTPATAVAPIIILTLAVADSIHILSRMFYERRRGQPVRDAISEALRINMHPVFLTSLTTAVGFLSLNTSDVPPFRELGNIVAVGVTAAFFYSIFLLPALMATFPTRPPRYCICALSVTDHLGAFVVRHRTSSLVVSLVCMLVLATGLTRLELSDNFLQYFDERFDIRTDSDFVQANLTGIDLIEHSFGSGAEGGIHDPAYLQEVEDFASWYRQQPEVMNVVAVTDIMKRLNLNMHGDRAEYYVLPEDRELAAQYLLLYEMSLPFGLDLNSQINVDRSATRVSAFINEPSTARQLDLEARGNAWLAERGLADRVSPGTGETLMWAHITRRNIASLLIGVGAALVLISVILTGALRSVKLGFVSLLPNLLPAIMAFGLWGLLVGRINLGTSVVAAMSLGIVVDDTVHFLSKYLRARRELELDAESAIRYAFSTVGMAMLTTSVVIVAGFLVLTFSGFGMNSAMGILTAIAIAFAVIADFFFLPPLLLRMEGQL
jgi:hypothetical protein